MLELSNPSVAFAAQQAANPQCFFVMVNRQMLYAAVPRRTLADMACATLSCEHLLILLNRYSVGRLKIRAALVDAPTFSDGWISTRSRLLSLLVHTFLALAEIIPVPSRMARFAVQIKLVQRLRLATFGASLCAACIRISHAVSI